ncbi:MAG: hypothetical protein U1F66_01335 [bacterium]
MKKIQFYFSYWVLMGLLACSGGVGGSAPGGPVGRVAGSGSLDAPSTNMAAPIQEGGAPSTRFDPGGRAYYQFVIVDDFKEGPEGQLLIHGFFRKISDQAKDLHGRVFKIVDARGKKFIDVPIQFKPDQPTQAYAEARFEVPFLHAKDVIDADQRMSLSFYISTDSATSTQEQWNKTLECGDAPNCSTLGWGVAILSNVSEENPGVSNEALRQRRGIPDGNAEGEDDTSPNANMNFLPPPGLHVPRGN